MKERLEISVINNGRNAVVEIYSYGEIREFSTFSTNGHFQPVEDNDATHNKKQQQEHENEHELVQETRT